MRSAQFERDPFENRPPTIGAHTQKFYGGYERLKRQPIELRLFHSASLAQMGVTADAWKFLGARVFVRPGLFGHARHCAASPPGGLKLIRAQFARGAVLDCGLAQDALRANI